MKTELEHTQMQDDLERYLKERVGVLIKDMLWRCQEAELSAVECYAILVSTFLDLSAHLIVGYTKSTGDKEATQAFYEILKKVRKKKG